MSNIVKRPWGSYLILAKSKIFLIKKIKVNPGGILSYQSHKFRSEHWIIIKGKANHSFGIEVAKLAGIPMEVIERSKSLLEDFEKYSKTNSFNLKKEKSKSSMKKFTYEKKKEMSKSENLIKSLNIDEITPQEALHILYKLQKSILIN